MWFGENKNIMVSLHVQCTGNGVVAIESVVLFDVVLHSETTFVLAVCT